MFVFFLVKLGFILYFHINFLRGSECYFPAVLAPSRCSSGQALWGTGRIMAASSSSHAVAAAGLAGCIPGVGQRLYGGHYDAFSWRARVGQVLYEKKGASAADVPAVVEAQTDLEKGLNMYCNGQACVF